MSCPDCQHDAKFMGYRPVTWKSLVGEIQVERAYYHCDHCHHGFCPDDEDLGVCERHTLGYREVVALAGVAHVFAEGADVVLYKMAGLTLSESSAQRVTESTGADVATRVAAGETFSAADQKWELPTDAEGHTVITVSVDLTSVPQQGPHGAKCPGRMPYVGAVFCPTLHDPATGRAALSRRQRQLRHVHYTAGLLELDELSDHLRQMVQAVVHVDQVDVAVGLTDGGAGLENCILRAVRGLAKEVVFVLDIFHVDEYLVELSQVCGFNEATRVTTLAAWQTELRERGGTQLLQTLQHLDLTSATPAAQETYRITTNYLRNNLHRMDYPTYLQRGWQIGSGVIESACKTVIGQRLKCGGMRWCEDGTNSMSHLRALFKSTDGHWDYYWTHLARIHHTKAA